MEIATDRILTGRARQSANKQVCVPIFRAVAPKMFDVKRGCKYTTNEGVTRYGGSHGLKALLRD